MSSQSKKHFSRVAPTTNAAKIVDPNPDRESLSLRNAGSVTVYLGKDTTLTAANGYPLETGDVLEDTASIDAWWAITAADTGDVAIIEVA